MEDVHLAKRVNICIVTARIKEIQERIRTKNNIDAKLPEAFAEIILSLSNADKNVTKQNLMAVRNLWFKAREIINHYDDLLSDESRTLDKIFDHAIREEIAWLADEKILQDNSKNNFIDLYKNKLIEHEGEFLRLQENIDWSFVIYNFVAGSFSLVILDKSDICKYFERDAKEKKLINSQQYMVKVINLIASVNGGKICKDMLCYVELIDRETKCSITNKTSSIISYITVVAMKLTNNGYYIKSRMSTISLTCREGCSWVANSPILCDISGWAIYNTSKYMLNEEMM